MAQSCEEAVAVSGTQEGLADVSSSTALSSTVRTTTDNTYMESSIQICPQEQMTAGCRIVTAAIVESRMSTEEVSQLARTSGDYNNAPTSRGSSLHDNGTSFQRQRSVVRRPSWKWDEVIELCPADESRSPSSNIQELSLSVQDRSLNSQDQNCILDGRVYYHVQSPTDGLPGVEFLRSRRWQYASKWSRLQAWLEDKPIELIVLPPMIIGTVIVAIFLKVKMSREAAESAHWNLSRDNELQPSGTPLLVLAVIIGTTYCLSLTWDLIKEFKILRRIKEFKVLRHRNKD